MSALDANERGALWQRKPCAKCEDDGWVETYDEDGFPCGARDCPYLGEAWHAPFNASGLLGGSVDGGPAHA